MTISKAEKERRAAAREQARRDAESGNAQAAIAAPSARHEKTGSRTVWVACKLPRGLVIQVCEEATIDRPTFGGGLKPTKVFMRVGEQVRLKGYAVPFGRVPNYPIIGDFGLTEVDREFWETWLAQNSKLDVVKNGLVFAHADQRSTSAEATEKESLRCGLEPLAQKGDPRADKTKSPNLTNVEVAEDIKAA